MEYSLEAEPLDLLLAYTWAAGGVGAGKGEPSYKELTNCKNLSEK